MVIVAQTNADAKIRPNLELVLRKSAQFVGAMITVGISLQESDGDESVSRVADRRARKEIGEIVEANNALLVRSSPALSCV